MILSNTKPWRSSIFRRRMLASSVVTMYTRSKRKRWKLAMESFLSSVSMLFLRISAAKKNESVLRDVEEQKERLVQLQGELAELQSSGVRYKVPSSVMTQTPFPDAIGKTPKNSWVPR